MSIQARLCPAPAQVAVLLMLCGHARFVYNIELEKWKMWHPSNKDRCKVNASSQMRELTEARKEFPWLAEGAPTVQQGALRDLDRAYRNWWTSPSHFKSPTYRKNAASGRVSSSGT